MRDQWRKKIRIIIVVYICLIGTTVSLQAQYSNNSNIIDSTYSLPIRMQIIDYKLNQNSKFDFNNSHYQYKAFFCRLEDKMFKKTNKNIRFRLGSVDYVNKLESK